MSAALPDSLHVGGFDHGVHARRSPIVRQQPVRQLNRSQFAPQIIRALDGSSPEMQNAMLRSGRRPLGLAFWYGQPSKELIDTIVATKERNPSWGCPRIAQQIDLAFGISIDKDMVRRVLAAHYRPVPHSCGPSWLTFIGHLKDSLWSIDLFRCESAILRTHWILLVMDQYTRRIIGFGVHAGTVDGVALCRMFHRAIFGQRTLPKHLSSDHDPLFRFAQWQANLRILEIEEIKTVPYVPLSHPFIERLIGTVRHEYLDRTLFWTTADLENKLLDFRNYYNGFRTHNSLRGRTPDQDTSASRPLADLRAYRWQSHCRGLYQTPKAA
jgi:putative transposase